MIPFPQDRVTPAQDLGQPASVVEHPVEAIRRDLQEHGVMATPNLVTRMLGPVEKIRSKARGMSPEAKAEWQKKWDMATARNTPAARRTPEQKALLDADDNEFKAKAAKLFENRIQQPEIPRIPPADPNRHQPP